MTSTESLGDLSLNPLAIFALFTLCFLGFFAGIALALLSIAAYLLYRTAHELAGHAGDVTKTVLTSLAQNTREIGALKLEVTSALTRVDAGAMHEASLLIQRTQRQFARTTDQFMKLLYSQEGAAQIAAEEARESQEAGEREDQAYSGIDPQAYVAHLQQRAQEKAQADEREQTLHKPPLDPDEAWRLQDEDDLAGGPLA